MSKKSTHQCKGGENCHEENHLCKISARKDLDRVKKLVKDAAYFCKHCGRAAHDPENLCDPSKI